MKRKLRIDLLKKACLPTFGLRVKALMLFVLFALLPTKQVSAQCIGPYEKFESVARSGGSPFTAGMIANGWSFSAGGAVVSNSGTFARSGANSVNLTAAAGYVQTPVLASPDVFSFYLRNQVASAGRTTYYKVEWSTDITFATITGTSGLLSILNTNYQLYSVSLSGLTNVYVRVTLDSFQGTTNVLFLDDFSWTNTDTTLNKVVVPALTGTSMPKPLNNCAGGTVVVNPTATYNFYDNGGDSDQYDLNQTNQVTFVPSGAGFAAGDRVRIQFISFAAGTGDAINVWDSSSTFDATTLLMTHTGTGIPANPTYISSASTDGSVTIRFTSDGVTNTNGVGFTILVDVVRCATPINLTAPTVGSTTATLNWNATAAGNYDVFYSTSATTPMSTVTPFATVATNSASLTGLSPSLPHYAWVRSRCGSSPDSYSPWSAVVSFTTVDCSAFVVSTNPSASPASYCVGNVATDLTAGASGGTVSSYQWYINAANNNTTGTLIAGATSATHKPQTAFGNVRYYYCVITSTLGCTVTTATSGAITVTAPPAFQPSVTAGTLVTGTSFQANWLAVGGATAYYLDVSTVNTFASFVPGYSNLAVGNVLLRSVTGLSPGTTYYYRVRAGNSCGVSASSLIITVTTTALPYCTPTAPATTTTSVNSFSTTGGISNISNLTTGFTAGGYANYTAQSCSQYPGSAVNYSITSLRTDSTDQTFYYYIWVDWNSDADFDDAGETILATTTYQAGPFTGSVLVPAAQPSGNYRMRVSTSWIGANTSCAINATYGRGEMEDYTITVVPVPPCAPSTPSALTATGVFATGATISWTDAALTPNSVYDYYVSTSAIAPLVGTTPTGTVTGANSVALTGLTLGQTYYFWVRSNCGTPNPWVGSSNFTTVNIDIITMTNGSMTTCNARFYDSGGPGGNYANNETYTYTIYPTAGSKLKVVFNSFFSETNYDGLMVYNGNSTAAPLIPSPLAVGTNAATAPAGSYRGQNTGAGIPGTFISTAADGSLTFRFTSDNSLVYAGWDAVVSCVIVPIITSFTPPTGVCAGSTPTVTLTGSNFTGATAVAFNGVPATFTVVSSTSITATLPAAATTGYITVTNSQGVGSSTTVFNVSPVPSTPNAGSDVSICNGGSGTTLNGSASSTSSSVVLTENFNSGAWPSSWTRTINGGFSPGDFRTPLEFLSGGNTWVGNGYTGYCSYFYTYLIGTGTSGDMVSPAMDLTPFNVANLTFWIYNSSGTDVLRVYANNNNGAFTQVGSNYATYGAWTQITVNLNAYTGSSYSSVRLKFTATSDGGTTNIGVDDIEVTGSNTSSFVWSPATGLSSTSILNPVANPTSTTTYTLTTSYGSGCSATDTVVVTVNPKPTVTITTPAANVCANSVIPVNVTGTAATYAWTSSVANTLFSDATGTTPYIPGTNTTIIYVKTPSTATITATGTSALGCPETSTVVFSVITKTLSGVLWSPGGTPPATGGTDNLILNSSWTGGSISGCSCTVTGGATVFNSGQTLSLTNGLTVSGGSVTFNNGASLLQTNDVANTGNIIYKRDTTPLLKFDYTYWSTPVSPLTLSQVSPTTPLFFEYNSTTEAWVQDLPSTVMTPAKGYIIRAPVGYSEFGPAAIYTASLVGVPNNGTYTIPVVGGANQLNLLGNPYPSAIDAASFVSDAANTSVIDGTIYLWTHNTPINVAYQYAGQDYAVWNILGGAGTYASPNPGLNTNVPNGFITAGQGFFIKGLSSGSATFKNSMRVSGNNTQFFRTSAAATTVLEKHRVWLEITNNENAYKQLLIGHITGGTDGLDRAFDGEMVDIGANVTFYTKVDNTKLSIQGRGLNFADTDTYALGYKSLIASNYTIRLSDFDGLFTNQNIYLEDTLLNIIHDLKTSPYVFTSGIGTFEDRFVLRFNTTALGVDDAAFTNSTVLVYKNGSDLMVESTVANLKEVQLYDVRGRLIASNENINQLSTRFKNLPIANQVLLVKITSDTGVVLTKKVIY
jgi:hypothetical protein